MLVAAVYLQNLDAESLQPGQQPLQSGLILERAVQDGADRLDRGTEPFEVEQNLRRENTGYPDLVVGRCHEGPQQVVIRVARFHGRASPVPVPHS